MTSNRLATALITVGLVVLSMTAFCQTPNDVPQGHWAYTAVQDLASKGMIKGYPPDGKFFGGRTVTRYEMATIIQRVIAQVESAVPTKTDLKTATPEVTKDDLDALRKLIDEFKVELTVVGADLQKVKDELDSVKTDVSALKDQVAKQDAAISQAKTDASDAKAGLKKAVDANKAQDAAITKLSDSKVGVGFGKMQVNGLLQAWISAAGKSDKSSALYDTFRIRRAQLLFTGSVTPKSYWAFTFDGAGSTSSTPTSQILDVYLGYNLTPSFAFQVGQMKLPLSMEGIRSSAQQYFVERSIFNIIPYSTAGNNGAGRFGNIYDEGAMAKYTTKNVEAQLGVFNDGGAKANSTDDNNAKEIIWHGQYKGVRYLTLGGYQEISGGVNGGFRTLRQRQGLEMAAAYGRHKLETEWAIARDGLLQTTGTPAVTSVLNPDCRSHGGYVAYLYRLNPTWEFGTRGEYWNPNRDLHNGAQNYEYDLTLGINYYIQGNNSKIQFNWVRKNINGPLSADGSGAKALPFLGVDRDMFLVNFQQGF